MSGLTDVKIRSAKPGDKDFKLSDDRGLHLLVRKNGSKLWQLRYRFAGKEQTQSLGRYPDVSLAEARDKRDASRKLLSQGINPMTAKLIASTPAPPSSPTFESIARQWLAVWSVGKSLRHVGYTERRLDTNVYPLLGQRPIADIQPPEIVRLLTAMQARGVKDLAHRTYQTINMVFRFAIAHGHIARNPAADFKPGDILSSHRQTNYARVSEKEFPDLLRALDIYGGEPGTRLAMKLLALTFVRTSELIQAKWVEIDFAAAQWRIPAERIKMKTMHVVPLARQSLELLRTLYPLTGSTPFLFPGQRRSDKPLKPISNNTILKALERLGYKGKMTGHGFRGIASTLLHEQGYPHEQIELQLAHQKRDAVSAAYNYAQYLPQRTQMMQDWADYLDRCREPGVVSVAPTATDGARAE